MIAVEVTNSVGFIVSSLLTIVLAQPSATHVAFFANIDQ